MIGQTVGHYKVTARLGAGGMGEVFLALDSKLDRKVALKFLPSAMWNDGEAKQRLIREAKAASKLDHPNVVTIHGIEESDERLFIIMAHVAGPTLDKYLANGSHSTDDLIALALQITDGLQHAHEAGVIHRDLKPGNILVDDKGRVRVLDFGLARMRGTSRLTHAGSTVGTLAYSPPELIQGNDAEPSSDIYSFGVVLYQMLTGHLPFETDHEAALLYSILRDEPRPLTDYDSAIPPALQAVVMRCLEKRPDKRYASCVALAAELKECRSDHISGTRAKAASDIPSIAILPFVNRSRDEEDEYFADGLADELLNVLAKIRGLRVAARSSAFTFKGQQVTVADVGRALNVGTVLEGSVRKSGNRVRISVQLVAVSDGYHLWSETYDRTLEDIFAVQDDIAQSVVKELRTALLGEEADSNSSRELKAEVAKAAKGRGHDAEAHRLYLQARHLLDRFSEGDTAKGMEYLREALALDPSHAPAWVQLARGYSTQGGFGWVPVMEGAQKAHDAVARALELAPDLPEAHVVLSSIQRTHDWDWKGAEASSRRAMELAPGSADVLRSMAALAHILCRFDESLELYQRALDQDPLSSSTYAQLGHIYRSLLRPADAERAYRKALEISPQRVSTHSVLAMVLVDEGRDAEAIAEAELETAEWALLTARAYVNFKAGRVKEAEAALQELEAKHALDSAFQISAIHAAKGDADAAFYWMDQGFELRDAGFPQVKCEPTFRTLHNDPRWPVFLKKMGLGD
ncbi:MAG: protein kinase [candidate division Zixibacteria bacterium]|nr:protein kinase [candidate division Zixibacteria bacterium]